MKNKIITAALAAILAFAPTPALAQQDITVIVNGEQVLFQDQQPVIIDGRTLVPVRAVFEKLGFGVEWVGEEQRVVLRNETYTINLTIGSDMFDRLYQPEGWPLPMRVEHRLDVPAQIINGSTMLPLRAVVESVGYQITWDGDTQTIQVFRPGEGPQPELEQEPEPEDPPELIIDRNTTPQQLLNAGFTREETFSIIEREIFYELNRVRTEAGLEPFGWSDELAAAARAHSQDMAVNNMRGHTGSDGSNSTERAIRHGWPYLALREVVGGMIGPARSTIVGVSTSPLHWAALMMGTAHSTSEFVVGVGIYLTESGVGVTTIQLGSIPQN
jgi:uncharacterized protein YkwD